MNPILLSSLVSLIGPQLLGRLFGRDPMESLRRHLEIILSPESISKRTNTLMDEWYRSPTYGAAQAGALAAGRQAEASVGRAGAGVTSGLDVLRSGAAAGVGSGTLSNIQSAAYQQNQRLAQEQAIAAANALMGGAAPRNISGEMLGASLNFLGPLFANYLGKHYGWTTGQQQVSYSQPAFSAFPAPYI